MLNSAIELITLKPLTNYAPTFISTDKRMPAGLPTSLGYYQIGELAQEGYAKGPIFRVNFVNLSLVGTASHIKIWGLENEDDNAPLFDIPYLQNSPIVDVYLKKFIFCDNLGNEVEENDYIILGYKKKVMPLAW